jgi:hypothetical protein
VACSRLIDLCSKLGAPLNIYNAFRLALLYLSIATLSSCIIYMPAARDDFSLLPKDQLSDLIQGSQYKVGHPNGGNIGFQALDQTKMNELARFVFIGKQRGVIEVLIQDFQGQCNSLHISSGNPSMECIVERQWRLKNVGAQFDTKYWVEPGIRLNIKFEFDANEIGKDLTLKVEDISKYKTMMAH